MAKVHYLIQQIELRSRLCPLRKLQLVLSTLSSGVAATNCAIEDDSVAVGSFTQN
jgi:hypothetical protein